MVYTLGDLMYYTARQLGVITEGTATGGSTTTIADTVDRTEEDDDWNGGTAWVLYDAGGASAAPQGDCREISDFANTGGVITVRTAFSSSSSVASGDIYAVAKSRYSLQVLRQAVNMALNRLGEILLWDDTSVTTADNQTEYTLPSMVTKETLKEIYLQTNDSDSDDNRWKLLYNWDIQETSTGTAKTLILPFQPISGYAIGLSYTGKHPSLLSTTSQLNESVPLERVYFAATYEALLKKRRNTNSIVADNIVRAQQDMLTAERDYPINIPAKTPHIIKPYTNNAIPDDEPNKVYI